MSIEIRNNGMEVFYEGRLIHSHYSNQVWTPSQIETSVQRVIDSKMSQPKREAIIRRGGPNKAALDDYFDSFVSGIHATLSAEAEKHRGALSYERMVIRKGQLDMLLNGLPLEVEETYLDDNGVEQTRMIANDLRAGYEPGHVMLDGLPLQIEQQLFDDEGNPTTTQMIDNPARATATEQSATVVMGIDRLLTNADVMAIVNARLNA